MVVERYFSSESFNWYNTERDDLGTYDGYRISGFNNAQNIGRIYRYDGQPFKLENYSGFSIEAFDVFQPFDYLNDPWISGDFYSPITPLNLNDLSNNEPNLISEISENGELVGIDAFSFDGDP